jgi:hypothetical protein
MERGGLWRYDGGAMDRRADDGEMMKGLWKSDGRAMEGWRGTMEV